MNRRIFLNKSLKGLFLAPLAFLWPKKKEVLTLEKLMECKGEIDKRAKEIELKGFTIPCENWQEQSAHTYYITYFNGATRGTYTLTDGKWVKSDSKNAETTNG